jgi:hypothetical protein
MVAIHRQRKYLVAHTDTHRGRAYAATSGEVRLLAETRFGATGVGRADRGFA